MPLQAPTTSSSVNSLKKLIQDQSKAHRPQNKSDTHQNWMMIWLLRNLAVRGLSQLVLGFSWSFPKRRDGFKTFGQCGKSSRAEKNEDECKDENYPTASEIKHRAHLSQFMWQLGRGSKQKMFTQPRLENSSRQTRCSTKCVLQICGQVILVRQSQQNRFGLQLARNRLRRVTSRKVWTEFKPIVKNVHNQQSAHCIQGV
jgi:hypothetical protein